MLREATKNVISQGVNVLTGQQEKFNWSSLAVSAITAPISDKIDRVFGSTNNNLQNGTYVQPTGAGAPFSLERLGSNLTGEFLKSATRAAANILVNRGGKLDWSDIATRAFGNAIGNTIADDIKYRYSNPATSRAGVTGQLGGLIALDTERGAQAQRLATQPANVPYYLARDPALDNNFTVDPDTGQFVNASGRTLPVMEAGAANYTGNVDESYGISPKATLDSTPANPKGLPLKEWIRWSMTTEGMLNQMQLAPSLPPGFDGQYLAPDKAVDLRAERENFQRNVGMALAAPTAGGLIAPGAYTLGSSFVVSQLGIQPAAELTTTSLLKGMGTSGAIGITGYLLTNQEESTLAGVAVAFGASALGGGLVKQYLNFAATLPNTAVPLTFSNAVTQATGWAYGFGTFRWLNYSGVTATGNSWWTTPIVQPTPTKATE